MSYHIPLTLCVLFINHCAAQVDLGTMESWGFNGVSSDDIMLMSDKKMKIKNLEYSGEGPAAWFMVGKDDDNYNEEFTDLDGVIIPDENGGCDRLGRYRGEDIELTLPAGMKFTDYDYMSIYCIRFSHNFGYVVIPKGTSFAPKTNATAPAVATTANGTAPAATEPVATAVQSEEDDLPGECDQEPERRASRPGPPGEEEEEEEEEE